MSRERTPLLIQTPIPNGFPQFHGEKQAPPPYGVVEVTQNGSIQDSLPRQPGIFLSTPIVVLAALIVGLILIFGITLIIPSASQEVVNNVLRQTAPDNADITPNSGFKDITIPQGMIRGFTRKSRQGRDYTAYYKVPYAEPPLGDLRFKDPIAPQTTWKGLRSISEVPSQCIQKEKYSDVVQAVGEEDCLYANVYVPTISSQEEPSNLPVMVYIHGGGFTDGNGSRYGAEYFMVEDLILITFQFRLGPFGFLNTQDDVIHGNMGFKDQVQMLKWTQDNIQHFGGDPTRVTIFGNSGGGISVSFLMLSPMTHGLFQRAITQSGANVCAGLNQGNMLNSSPQGTIEEVGRVLNCDSTDTIRFLECLRTKDAGEIALVRTPQTVYSLSIENRSDDQVFMPDTPYNMLKTNPVKVPYIIGVVNAEWISQGIDLISNDQLVKLLNNDFGGVGNELFGWDLSKDELLSIKDFYFGDKEIGNSTFREAINLATDKGMTHCSYVSAKMHAENSPTYLYYLTKPPALSYADKDIKGFPAKELGMVNHADELQYQFLYDGYPEIPVGDPEYYEFSSYFVKQWARFATNGAPSPDWEPVSRQSSTFWFELNDNPGRTEAVRDRMDFWDQFTHKQLGYE